MKGFLRSDKISFIEVEKYKPWFPFWAAYIVLKKSFCSKEEYNQLISHKIQINEKVLRNDVRH